MKVLHIFKTFYPDSFGGIEEVVFQLCKGMEKHGYVSDVFTLSNNPKLLEETTYEGIRVYRAKEHINIAANPMSLSAIWKLKKIINKYDLIHLHYPYPFADLLMLALRPKQPIILTYHSDIVRQKYLKYLYAPLETYLLRKVDKIICTSPNYISTSQNLQKYRDKVECVILGLPESKERIRIESGSKFYSHRELGDYVLFLGGLRDYKGITDLLKAAKDARTTIVIAGGGPKLNFFKERAKELDINNVLFTGALSEADKAFFLDHCCALILPSTLRTEAFGLVQLEASMRSKPLISTELGTGTSFVNIHEQTGLVIEPNEPAQISAAINRLVEHPKERLKMGRLSRERYERYFTASMMCEGYKEVYQAYELLCS